jgi:hypothetical protein
MNKEIIESAKMMGGTLIMCGLASVATATMAPLILGGTAIVVVSFGMGMRTMTIVQQLQQPIMEIHTAVVTVNEETTINNEELVLEPMPQKKEHAEYQSIGFKRNSI